jgi:hypothetical protein
MTVSISRSRNHQLAWRKTAVIGWSSGEAQSYWSAWLPTSHKPSSKPLPTAWLLSPPPPCPPFQTAKSVGGKGSSGGEADPDLTWNSTSPKMMAVFVMSKRSLSKDDLKHCQNSIKGVSCLKGYYPCSEVVSPRDPFHENVMGM